MLLQGIFWLFTTTKGWVRRYNKQKFLYMDEAN